MSYISMSHLFASLSVLAANHVSLGFSHSELCASDLSNSEAGLLLLQTGSKRTVALSSKQDSQGDGEKIDTHHAVVDVEEGRSVQDWLPGEKNAMQPGQEKESIAGLARRTLPKRLYELGLKVLQTEEILDAVVNNTRQESSLYAGENVTFRIPMGDQVDKGDNYGLDSLGQLSPDNGMMNMMDIGANLGRVSIAAFLKYPQRMRIIAVEPVPSTFFLMCWNLWLNGVPLLTEFEFKVSSQKAGILALNNGVARVDRQQVGLCWTPPFTMGSTLCDCELQVEAKMPQAWSTQCLPIVSRTIDHLLSIFGRETVTFLKMDCEGCESHAMEPLMKWTNTSGHKILRFAGELHGTNNIFEDFACQFEGGRWFLQVCYLKTSQGPKYQPLALNTRCQQGPTRPSCNQETSTAEGRFVTALL